MPSEVAGDQSVEALRRELAEAREQQTATAEILRVISSSPMDLGDAFASIAASAARLCDAYDAAIHRVDGDFLAIVAHHGPIPAPSTFPLRSGFFVGRAVLEQRTIHVADVLAAADEYPEGSDRARSFFTQTGTPGLGFRTILAVPLIRAGKATGVISIRRPEVRAFTDRQIELLKIFADQAVIAIENTRLFEEVQTRTKELQDSLDRQMATSEVLGVISRSPNEVQPVLDTIVATAHRLCQSERTVIWRLEGETFRAVAHCGQPEERVEAVYSARLPVSRGSMVGRATLARTAVQVKDVATDPELVAATHALNLATNVQTALAVPLLLKGHPIGVITLARTRVAPFDDKQVALIESFADQAVIAIENSRLFEAEQAGKRELQESLQQQTATADVLKVISRSAFDLQTVLDTLVESAARLCEADTASIWRPSGDIFQFLANYAFSPDYRSMVERYPLPMGRGSVCGRTMLEGRPVQVADVLADPEYTEAEVARKGGFRTLLGVPLMRERMPIGVISLQRSTVWPFTDKQIELLTSLADQAVIAIENTRLFEEVQARNRDLTALGEVGRAVSSTLDLKAVLKTIVDRAVNLSNTDAGSIFYYHKATGSFELGETTGLDRTLLQSFASSTFPRKRPVLARRLPSASRCRSLTLPSLRVSPYATPCLKPDFVLRSLSHSSRRRSHSEHSSCADDSPASFQRPSSVSCRASRINRPLHWRTHASSKRLPGRAGSLRSPASTRTSSLPT